MAKPVLPISPFCANCTLYGWKEPKPASLKLCQSCKVVHYCSRECQEENWKLVHKDHCKKLLLAKEEERAGKDTSRLPVCLFSHHPFPKSGDPEDITETLVILIQKILIKMQSTDHPAFAKLPGEMKDLEIRMKANRSQIWFMRKLGLKVGTNSGLDDCSNLFNKTRKMNIQGKDALDLWSTLHLVWLRLDDHLTLIRVNSLKEPMRSVPEKAWEGQVSEAGLFATRVQELIQAFNDSGNQFPTFQHLLKVFCGGSLVQRCSFCNIRVTVKAVCGEAADGGGDHYQWLPLVVVKPHLPVLFSCAGYSCQYKLADRTMAHEYWRLAVQATGNKLAGNACHFCFKLPEEAHRCGKCLTKHYCSKECQAKDWEEKHRKLCRVGADENKVKGGLKVRLASEKTALGKTLASTTGIGGENGIEMQEVEELIKMCQRKKAEKKVVQGGKKKP